MDTPITIAAYNTITALGEGLDSLKRALADNTSMLCPCNRFDDPIYQTNVVGAIPDECWAELRDKNPDYADAPAFLLANHVLRSLRADALGKVGLVLSTTKADITALERLHSGQPCSDIAKRHVIPAQLASDLAAANNITGPIRCVSIACISGLMAIQVGADLLRRGEADNVFVVGVDILSHFVLAGFTSLKSLDPDGCRPFDKDRIGLSLGEGAGAILLTRNNAPGLRIMGWGSSNDANHLTGPSRDGSGLALAMQRALRMADIQSNAVNYVNAHGTGTPYNDTMEALALKWVFGKSIPPFSSSKGLLGHTLGAAGILETILCVVAARMDIIPGTPRLRSSGADIPSEIQSTPRHNAKLHTLMKINSGFAGTNAALILQKVKQ